MTAYDDDPSTTLMRLARGVTARHSLDDVLGETFRSLRPLVDFGGGSIQLLDDEGCIRMAAADPTPPGHVLAQRVPLATSVAGRAILTERPVYLPDLDVAQLPGPARRISAGVRSYFAVPLVVDGAAMGVLQVDAPEVDAWSDDDRAVFVAAAPIVAAAIQNARAHARAAAARAYADAAGRRLAEAQQVSALARICLEAGDIEEALRRLAQLEQLLGHSEESGSAGVRPPAQRVPAAR